MRRLRLLLPFVALASAIPASAQIFKCTDAGGNVTYQNAPCPKGEKADRIEVFDNTWTADRSEKEAEWRRRAAEHRVVTGMPDHWVREALGNPKEIRGTTIGGATEVWSYNLPDRDIQVGMLDRQVVWFRESPLAGLPGAPLVVPSEEAAPDNAKGNDSRRSATLRGRECAQVVAELGPPARTSEVPAAQTNSGEAVKEYFYEPAGAERPMRMRIVCVGGKVEGVERTVVR